MCNLQQALMCVTSLAGIFHPLKKQLVLMVQMVLTHDTIKNTENCQIPEKNTKAPPLIDHVIPG